MGLHDVTDRVTQEQLGGGAIYLATTLLLVNTDILSLIKTIGCGGQKLFLQAPLN